MLDIVFRAVVVAFFAAGGLFVRASDCIRRQAPVMSFDLVLGALTALGLLVSLGFVLIRPERF